MVAGQESKQREHLWRLVCISKESKREIRDTDKQWEDSTEASRDKHSSRIRRPVRS